MLDIIVNERLYCPFYKNLNDPFEGVFYSPIYLKSFLVGGGRPVRFMKRKSVEDIFTSMAHVRVCSLSASLSDIRLWSYYAEGHKGVAIGIDFKGIEDKVTEVKYSEKLPMFGDGLLTSPTPREVLSRKTSHWGFESEYRIITDQVYFSINGRISGIYAGHRIDENRLDLLQKIVGARIPIKKTKINETSINVET